MTTDQIHNGVEIERRFLVVAPFPVSKAISRTDLTQAYLKTGKGRVDRIRFDGTRWVRTRKKRLDAMTQEERETVLSDAQATALLKKATGHIVRKTRFVIPAGHGLNWEVDVYDFPMKGLVVAEIELPTRGTAFARPAWIGPEITSDGRFGNAALSRLKLKDQKTLWSGVERLLERHAGSQKASDGKIRKATAKKSGQAAIKFKALRRLSKKIAREHTRTLAIVRPKAHVRKVHAAPPRLR